MKLKTIKDMQEKGNEQDYVNCSVVSVTSLTNEAIKRIKDIRKREEEMYMAYVPADKELMKMFNIKEKDLK